MMMGGAQLSQDLFLSVRVRARRSSKACINRDMAQTLVVSLMVLVTDEPCPLRVEIFQADSQTF